MTQQHLTNHIAILDDDPSVVARGLNGASEEVLIGPRRTWTMRQGLRLECGAFLAPIEVAYETWGSLNEAGDNAVLVCHALTGDSHAAGKYNPDDTRLGWWDSLIGPGRAFDTRRYSVVCANVLGGCQGTTGPASIDPATGKAYGSAFPQVTVRDIVRSQYELLRGLGVQRLAVVVGGSLGGMQALEWSVMYPDFVDSTISIGASLEHSAQGIAYNLVGRQAIMLDPAWQGGNYYESGVSPERGLSIARMVGMITYQSEESMRRKFHRDFTEEEPEAYYRSESRFQVENYLHYQGESLVKRFDANSYLVLSRAMDLHDLGYERGGVEAALGRVSPSARTLVIGISSDILFPTHLQREIVEQFSMVGRHVEYSEVVSPWGHDAFLIEYGQLTEAINGLLSTSSEAANYAPGLGSTDCHSERSEESRPSRTIFGYES